MKLIDAETMWQCETCFHHLNGRCNSSFCDAGEDYRPAFNKLKIIEAEPIIHAHWIAYPDCGVTRCSNCDWSIEEAWYSKRCPKCGAHMDEVLND